MKKAQLSFLCVLLLSACSSDDRLSAIPDDPESVALGKGLYQQHCASCHGENLEGQPNWRKRGADGKLPAPPHDDSGHTWHHGDKMLFEITKNGMVSPYAPDGYLTDMGAWKDILTDKEIWSVLAFIKSRWSDESQRIQAEFDRKARENE